MEHIDDKMTRLEMYHRVINDIATALGYRMGDTFEPEALVKEVKQLVAIHSAEKTYAELAKENRTAMATLATVEAVEKEVNDGISG